MNVPVTLNEMMENTEKYMGSNFLRYSAKDANCQNSIDSILKAKGLSKETMHTFIMQEPKKIINKLPKATSIFMNAVKGASKGDVLLN